MPDLEAEMNLEDAPRDLLEQAFERMLTDGIYISPEPFYDLQLAMKLGSLHYQRARLAGGGVSICWTATRNRRTRSSRSSGTPASRARW